MERSICKIQKPNNVYGTGFICKISNKENIETKNVLITCNHVLNEIDLTLGKDIYLYFNNINQVILKINKLRKIYTSPKYDVTIIELKSSDNINEEDLFEIDENIFENDLYKFYKNRQIYILHYPNGNEIKYSTEVLKNVVNEYEIRHYCSTDSGSSGAPIINFENRKVIGVHAGFIKSKQINVGTLLNYPIEEFYKLYDNKKNKNKNKIEIILDIKNEDLNKKIYFLDNLDFSDDLVHNKKLEESLIELNNENVLLYINDEKNDFSHYFIPKKEGQYTIKLEFNIKMKNCCQMFHGCYNIINLDLSNFNTEKVTDMKYMFSGCYNLENINLIAFNTENVTNMSYMFYECRKLKNIDLSTFNTQNVTDMSGMFCACTINSLNLSYLNTKNVVNMTHMFYRCENLTNIDVSKFNTENVNNMSGLFAGCLKVNNINLSSFNTKNVYYMSSMFYDCRNITNLDLTNFDTKNVDNMSNMFLNCYNLRTLDLSSFNTKNVINMAGMFSFCKKLVNLDLSSFNTDNAIYMYNIFLGCESLYNLDISNFNCSNKKNKQYNGIDALSFFADVISSNDHIFRGCESLTNITISYKDSQNPNFIRSLRFYARNLHKIKVKR